MSAKNPLAQERTEMGRLLDGLELRSLDSLLNSPVEKSEALAPELRERVERDKWETARKLQCRNPQYQVALERLKGKLKRGDQSDGGKVAHSSASELRADETVTAAAPLLSSTLSMPHSTMQTQTHAFGRQMAAQTSTQMPPATHIESGHSLSDSVALGFGKSKVARDILFGDCGISAFSEIGLGFEQWAAVRTLDVHCNQLSSLVGSPLPEMAALRHCDLSWNALQCVPHSCFRRCAALQTLNLSGNRLRQLATGSLRGLKQLHSLSLSFNQFTLKQDIELFAGLCELGAHCALRTLTLDCNAGIRSKSTLRKVLNCFEASLRCVSLKQTGVASKLSAEDLRAFVVTKLPFITSLNGERLYVDSESETEELSDSSASSPVPKAKMSKVKKKMRTDSRQLAPVTSETTTPRIDELLSRFRKRGAAVATKSTATQTNESDFSQSECKGKSDEERIEFLVSKLKDVFPFGGKVADSVETEESKEECREQSTQTTAVDTAVCSTQTAAQSTSSDRSTQSVAVASVSVATNTECIARSTGRSVQCAPHVRDCSSQTPTATLRSTRSQTEAVPLALAPCMEASCAQSTRCERSTQTVASTPKKKATRSTMTDGVWVDVNAVAALRSELRRKSAESQRLSFDISDLKQVLCVALESERSLKKALRELNAVCSEQSKKLADVSANEEREIEWTEARQKLEATITECKNTLKIKEMQLKDASEGMIRKTEKLKSTETGLASARRKLVDANDKCATLRESLESFEHLPDKLTSTKRRLRAAEKELAAAKDECREKAQMLEFVTKEVEELQCAFNEERAKWREEKKAAESSRAQMASELRAQIQTEKRKAERSQSQMRKVAAEFRSAETQLMRDKSEADSQWHSQVEAERRKVLRAEAEMRAILTEYHSYQRRLQQFANHMTAARPLPD